MKTNRFLKIWMLVLAVTLTLPEKSEARSRSVDRVAHNTSAVQHQKKSYQRASRRDDRQDDRHSDRHDRHDRHDSYLKFRLGIRLLTLPARHTRLVVGPAVYFYSDGVYFVQHGSAYVVVAAPVGARVVSLPYGFRSLHLGSRRFFHVNSTYYIYVPATRDYVVVAEPQGVDNSQVAGAQNQNPDPIIYPSAGQTDEQVAQARYECHRWALDESGFDPSTSQNQNADADQYYRAIKACLSGRGYTVG